LISENKINIAIDGAAATGKSTLAKRLAKELYYIYVDTGAMYRAVTYFALKKNSFSNILQLDQLLKSLPDLKIEFKSTAKGQIIFLNGEDISNAIRHPEINLHVSTLASYAEIRKFLVIQQQQIALNKGVVMDGRDIGTVVLPHAECKFFLKATSEIRAQRRYEEQQKAGIDESYHSVLQNVLHRDRLDATRDISPLKKAFDAFEIDVTKLTIDEVFEKMREYLISLGIITF
jgi:cytidylate kinase